MKDRREEIRDDEIRIITSEEPRTGKRKRPGRIVWACALIVISVTAAVAVIFFPSDNEREPTVLHSENPKAEPIPGDAVPAAKASAVRSDTVVNGVGLDILTPVNAVPTLVVGNEALSDSSAVLIVQAADVRGDNGDIAGTFVVGGRLVSKGEAKAGFCSIINGEVTVGVADATPMLEQALMSDGYFFRQYPLVVGGQIVENKPKGRSARRALAELDGKICVIISRDRVTYHDFSQAITDIGVRNAISLVGGDAYGVIRNSDGESFTFGVPWNNDIANVNYIVWR